MLAIRLKRIGRKGRPIYRIAVQEAQRSPASGRVVAYVGTYDPHAKTVSVQKEDAQKYLDNGAQPTPRVVKLLKAEGVKLPKWVVEPQADKKSAIKNLEKLRKNRPAEPVADEAPAETAPEESAPEEVPAVEDVASETPAEESPAETEVKADAGTEKAE